MHSAPTMLTPSLAEGQVVFPLREQEDTPVSKGLRAGTHMYKYRDESLHALSPFCARRSGTVPICLVLHISLYWHFGADLMPQVSHARAPSTLS